MGLYYGKHFGGRRAGVHITADKHGLHKPVFRFRFCGFAVYWASGGFSLLEQRPEGATLYIGAAILALGTRHALL
ncbi:hypothetical protein JHW43_003845 [Diplocarpon mali]|nr:hypothetical protein JHW43_003845 [Diplocarpon mali]